MHYYIITVILHYFISISVALSIQSSIPSSIPVSYKYNIPNSINVHLTIPNNASTGTVIKVTCLTSGAGNAAELWLAQVFSTGITVTNA